MDSRMVHMLAGTQEGLVTEAQLSALGLPKSQIRHRVESGRLHPVQPGVFAVGRPQISLRGRRLAAVLSCGECAAASHVTAAAIWALLPCRERTIHVSIPYESRCTRPGVRVHRRRSWDEAESTVHDGIRVTTVLRTLLDLAAARLPREQLLDAVGEADRSGLLRVPDLRTALVDAAGARGTRRLTALVGPDYRRTDSRLERRFLELVRDAGLPLPETQHQLGRHRLDFFWPEHALDVETDGLTYHRTPEQQAKDRIRDQELTARGMTVLRFTRAQVHDDPGGVVATLRQVMRVNRS